MQKTVTMFVLLVTMLIGFSCGDNKGVATDGGNNKVIFDSSVDGITQDGPTNVPARLGCFTDSHCEDGSRCVFEKLGEYGGWTSAYACYNCTAQGISDPMLEGSTSCTPQCLYGYPEGSWHQDYADTQDGCPSSQYCRDPAAGDSVCSGPGIACTEDEDCASGASCVMTDWGESRCFFSSCLGICVTVI